MLKTNQNTWDLFHTAVQDVSQCNVKTELNKQIIEPMNTLRSRQDGRHFADDIFKCIFLKWKCMSFTLDLTEACSYDSN